MTDLRTQRFVTERESVWGRPGPMGSGRRRAYVELVDEWLQDLFSSAAADEAPVALVGVGGYGRRELSPGSDLDLVLLYAPGFDVSAIADRLWYPVWDAGIRLDHSVRTVDQALKVADEDLKAALGLLDVRHIAGRTELSTALREKSLANWRANAGRRLPELRAWGRERAEARGEVAYLLEPDLKDSFGGLREVTALRAIAASWVADVPHTVVEQARDHLLDVRDALHCVTSRAQDRLGLEEQPLVAELLGIESADALLRGVCGTGRAVAYANDLVWHRVERAAANKPRRGLLRRNRSVTSTRMTLADGVVADDFEVTLARDARPQDDPVLGLKAAAAAAQAGLRLSPSTVDRLAAESVDLPQPWPRSAREAFVSLLGAGTAAVPVWEALDQAGLWSRWIPGWDRLRALPQKSPVHRFTVDRHLVEAAVQASALTRRVARPDLLMVGALLHDVGKGLKGDHTTRGIPIVADLAPRMGFDESDTQTLVDLCRHHLLLPEVATRRDLGDPATAHGVADAVGSREFLDLLYALTEADAKATGPAAWTDWRAALVRDLVNRTHAVLRGDLEVEVPRLDDDQRALADSQSLEVLVRKEETAWTVTIAADDRRGLLAAVAGVLSMNRLAVRAATVETVGERAVQVWTVQPDFGEPPGTERLRQDLRRALDGSLDIAARLEAREEAYPRPKGITVPDPRVDVLADASADATVLEVRAHDGPALLFRIGSVLAETGIDVRAARVSTLGSEAVDVFYLCGPNGGPLDLADAAEIADAVLAAL